MVEIRKAPDEPCIRFKNENYMKSDVTVMAKDVGDTCRPFKIGGYRAVDFQSILDRVALPLFCWNHEY